MPKLFSKKKTETDIRPSLFAMASLMIILLPTLLLSLSTQKFTALPLSIASTQDQAPQDPNRVIQEILLKATEDGFVLHAKVRSTDVRADASDVEERNWDLKSLSALQSTLQSLKKIDPKHRRIQIQPLPQNQTSEVVRWMDLVSKSPDGVLFPEIMVQSQK